MELQLGRALKSLVFGMPALLKGGEPKFRAGEERLALRQLGWPEWLTVWSDAFDHEGALPRSASADGGNVSPPLRWTGLPDATRSLALIVEDPDAPTVRPFLHWAVFNIDPTVAELYGGARFAIQGKNSMMKKGYVGAAPPPRDKPHRYHFQVFALDSLLPLRDGAGRSALLSSMRGRVLAGGEVVGTFAR